MHDQKEKKTTVFTQDIIIFCNKRCLRKNDCLNQVEILINKIIEIVISKL